MRMIHICQVFDLFALLLGEMHIPLNHLQTLTTIPSGMFTPSLVRTLAASLQLRLLVIAIVICTVICVWQAMHMLHALPGPNTSCHLRRTECRMLMGVPRWENSFHQALPHRGESRGWEVSQQSNTGTQFLCRGIPV